MKILAIETSCDDTGIAILETKGTIKPRFKVLSNIVSSQTKIHQPYGGVFPMMAKREHQKNLVPVFIQALKEAKLLKTKKEITVLEDKKLQDIFEKEADLYKLAKKFLENYEKPNIDAIAVTYGPGLEPCLWVGVNFARALSYFWNIPIIPINHIEAHILVNLLENKDLKFPAISLIVSGGHTQLILVKGIGKYEIIGETRDDAAGECFDKAAKILGLEYPGGPIIAKIATQFKAQFKKSISHKNRRPSVFMGVKLPRPMINSKDYDFSFSGLKTAVLYETKGKKLTKEYVADVCFEVQQSIIDVLMKKTFNATKDSKIPTTKLSRILGGKAIGTIILGGGVSANSELRSQFKLKVKSEKLKVNVVFPDKKLSTDNGLMIAVAAFFNKNRQTRWQNLKADANLRID